MNVGVRRALPADAVVLGDVLEKACTQAGQPVPDDAVAGWLQAPGVFTYLAEDDAPFGLVTVGPGEALAPHDGPIDAGCIQAWCLLQRRQRQGIGRKLLVHGMSVLKRRRYERAQIWVPDHGERVISVVTKAGFADAGIEKIMNTAAGNTRLRCFETSLADLF